MDQTARAHSSTMMLAPSDDDPLGKAMLWQDLERGLKMANSELIIVKPDQSEYWYPGRDLEGVSLWLRPPGTEGCKKVTTFNLRSTHGAIPEHTQMTSKGLVMARGWRSILWRVIKAKASTQRALERIFKIDLNDVQVGKSWCPRCKLDAQWERAYAASGLCELHEGVRKNAEHHQKAKRARKEEVSWLVSKYGDCIAQDPPEGASVRLSSVENPNLIVDYADEIDIPPGKYNGVVVAEGVRMHFSAVVTDEGARIHYGPTAIELSDSPDIIIKSDIVEEKEDADQPDDVRNLRGRKHGARTAPRDARKPSRRHK